MTVKMAKQKIDNKKLNVNIDLIACDLDGTLLSTASVVSRENLDAIHRLTESGVEFVINTGRTVNEIPDELMQCRDIRYIIYSDGSAILERESRKTVLSEYVETPSAFKILDILSRYDTMTEFYENGHPVTLTKNLNDESFEYYNIDKSYRPVVRATRRGVNDLKEYIKQNNKIELINIFFRHQSEREKCADELKAVENTHFTTSMTNNIEIMAAGASKGAALAKLCLELGIDKNCTAAIGDSRNDFSMFDQAGLAFAAANAEDAVKARADIVLCKNSEHIIKYLIENYIEV